jgi:hypothetical protein
MKTQLQKPSAGKARYTPEYKQQALEHWRSSGRSAARVAATSRMEPGRNMQQEMAMIRRLALHVSA